MSGPGIHARAQRTRRIPRVRLGDGDAGDPYLVRRALSNHDRPADLPGSDGFSILSAVRADPPLESIPVIVISTSSRDEDIARSDQPGCNAYVVKPERASTFIQVIHAVSHFLVECRSGSPATERRRSSRAGSPHPRAVDRG